MRGTIISHTTKSGKKSWGYSFFTGRDETGKRIQKLRRGFAKKGDAEETLRQAIDDHQHTPAAERAVPAFAEFFERWYTECVTRECSPKTAERYHELGQYAVRLFGGTPLDKLDTMQLAGAMNRLADHGGQVTKQHPQGRPLAAKT